MSAEGKTPPIKIPIEVTIEDKEFDKVREKIGERKSKRKSKTKRNLDTHFGDPNIAPTSEAEEEKEEKRREKEEEKEERRKEKEEERKEKKRKKIEEQIRKEKIRYAEKLKSQRNSNILFGIRQIGNIGSPLQLLESLAARIAPIAIPLMIVGLTQKISKLLTQKGSLFDLTFRNIADSRYNVLRSRESQQEIRAGFEGKSQLIVTTRAGTTSPVSSYNTYEQRNNNPLEFEKMRAVREVGGI